MGRILAALAVLLYAAGAAAQTTSIPKEIVAFYDVDVQFVNNVKKCNINDTKIFEERARKKLMEIGLKQDNNSVINVGVRIAGDSFGVLGALCSYSVRLGFQTNLSAQNIVTDNQDVRAAIDRLKTFPVTLWQALHFGVVTLTEEGDPKESGGSPNARNAALKGIDVLVDRFDNVRN